MTCLTQRQPLLHCRHPQTSQIVQICEVCFCTAFAHVGQNLPLRRGRDCRAQERCQCRRDVDLLYVAVDARFDPSAGQDQRLDQDDGFLAAMTAAIDVAVVAGHQDRVLGQIERFHNVAQQIIGALGSRVPARVLGASFVMAGVINLQEVDQGQRVRIAAQRG